MAKTEVTRAKINLPANVAAQIQKDAEAFRGKVTAPSGNRIQVTQSKQFKLPSGETNTEITGIIVDFVSANFYYDTPYQKDVITPPKCFAISSSPKDMAPSENSPEVQADACATCWANEFQSASNGKGKACQNTRVLAVLPPDADEDTPLMLLKVSPTAIKAFDGYVNALSRNQLPPYAVMTTCFFDPANDYPSLRFEPAGPIDEDMLAVILARREEAREVLFREPDLEGATEEKPTAKSAAKPARGRASAVRKPAARRKTA